MPEELQDRGKRLDRLEEFKTWLEQEKAEKVANQKEKVEEPLRICAGIQWTGNGNRGSDKHCGRTYDGRKRCKAADPHDRKSRENIAALELKRKKYPSNFGDLLI